MILGYEANIGLIYYGPKWSLAEMVMGPNGHGPKWLWAEMTRNQMIRIILRKEINIFHNVFWVSNRIALLNHVNLR